MSLKLNELQQKYSAALYAYFRVANYRSAFDKFVSVSDQNPVFEYEDNLGCQKTQDLSESIQRDLAKLTGKDSDAKQFLEQRLLETETLHIFCEAKENPGQVTAEQVRQYMANQKSLYGTVDPVLFGQIINFLRQKSVDATPEMTLIESKLSLDGISTDQPMYRPKKQTFEHYRKLYQELYPELFGFLTQVAELPDPSNEQVVHTFEEGLRLVGAEKQGWKIIRTKRGSNLMVSKHRKTILIPNQFQPKSALRLAQMVAHEVGCHVLANDNGLSEISEEGLALVLEQLVANQFSYKRTMRYLAICLAIGIDGKKRDFKEVYEIMQAAFSVISDDTSTVNDKAFSETCRVFRGGIPSVPGMCYIKDKVYLEQNLEVWKQLEQRLLDQEAFKGLFGQ